MVMLAAGTNVTRLSEADVESLGLGAPAETQGPKSPQVGLTEDLSSPSCDYRNQVVYFALHSTGFQAAEDGSATQP